MEFAAGLIVGVLLGMLSWLALAAWLETGREWAAVPASQVGPASTKGFDPLR